MRLRRRPCSVAYRGPADADVPALMKDSDALVIPAVGPKLAPALFEGTKLKLVQVTGAGVDRLDQAALTRLGIPVANVPGGSNSAVAEYAVTAASVLLRRFAWADAEIKAGNYAKFRARMVADNLAGLEGLTVGLVGFGTIGRAVAQAFHRMGAKLCFFDPAAGDAGAGEVARRARRAARRAARDLRRGVAACAAAAGDAEPDRREGAFAHEARRDADSRLARRHRRRGGARREPDVGSSRRRGGRRLFDRAAGRPTIRCSNSPARPRRGCC